MIVTQYKTILLPVIACVLGWSTWKYPFQKDENINLTDGNSPFQKPSKELTELEAEETDVDRMSDKSSVKEDPFKQNLENQLFFTSAATTLTGSMSLDTVFFLLLIHLCGANTVAAAFTVFVHVFSAEGLLELAVSLLPAVYATYKCKRDKAELEKKNSDLVTTLMEVKTELEKRRNQLRDVLDDVEIKKEENKQKLQSVEKEITKREATFDKPEELLRQKEDLLVDQWKLDQMKKDTERQLLIIEKLMEPIEIQVTEIHRKN